MTKRIVLRLFVVAAAVLALSACCGPSPKPAPPKAVTCNDVGKLTTAQWTWCWPLGFPVTQDNCSQWESPAACASATWPTGPIPPQEASSSCEWPDVPGNGVAACPD